MPGKIVPAAPVPPFVTFVASAVPMVFDNSMSYYEALCALWKWLQDDVIDVINNNATVTNEYINLTNEYTAKFIELKDYVDNYFDNLDVQEEINNKLDAMVEDGTLQQLIASYLQTQIIYDTTLDMIADAEHLQNGVRVETLGYRTIDDNGAAFFVIKNTGTADGKSVIALDGGLYAHMVYKHDFVTPEMFGAYGDGVNDHNDSDAIQFAINTGKIVEFARKTYMCYSLTISSPAVLHGNGATLKRPELDIAPYSLTVDQMKWVRTISVSAAVELHDLIFDNNCFTMWQLSDGYAQEQSASVIFNNDNTKFKVIVDGCKCQNSAGDGLLISNNANIKITNYTSTECFRGGITIIGNSEVNIDGWESNAITLPDGIDVEVDSASVNSTPLIINMNNVIMDYDLDLGIPADATCNINNLVMRPFDASLYNGIITNVLGTLNISNSVIRRGKSGNVVNRVNAGGKVRFNNCELYNASNSEPMFKLETPASTSTNDQEFVITNCYCKCYDFLKIGVVFGKVKVLNSSIECTNSFVVSNGAVEPQPNYLEVSNCSVKFATVFATIIKSAYATFADGVNLILNNVKFISGETSTEIYCDGGKPKIKYSALICDTPLIIHKAFAGSPIMIGNNRVVTVATASDLTFAGWVAGDDIAVALDTGTRYRYTSGTSWTAI